MSNGNIMGSITLIETVIYILLPDTCGAVRFNNLNRHNNSIGFREMSRFIMEPNIRQLILAKYT